MKKFYLSLLTVICFFCIIGCKHPQTPGNPQKPSDSATTGQDTEEPVKQEAEIRNENGTMVITKAGTISEENFQNFIKNGTLTVAGPLTEENYELIAQLPITKLDLSGVTDIPGGLHTGKFVFGRNAPPKCHSFRFLWKHYLGNYNFT